MRNCVEAAEAWFEAQATASSGVTIVVNSKLCLQRMETQQKYGYMRSTIVEENEKRALYEVRLKSSS